jgi:hypothetical protein
MLTSQVESLMQGEHKAKIAFVQMRINKNENNR